MCQNSYKLIHELTTIIQLIPQPSPLLLSTLAHLSIVPTLPLNSSSSLNGPLQAFKWFSRASLNVISSPPVLIPSSMSSLSYLLYRYQPPTSSSSSPSHPKSTSLIPTQKQPFLWYYEYWTKTKGGFCSIQAVWRCRCVVEMPSKNAKIRRISHYSYLESNESSPKGLFSTYWPWTNLSSAISELFSRYVICFNLYWVFVPASWVQCEGDWRPASCSVYEWAKWKYTRSFGHTKHKVNWSNR